MKRILLLGLLGIIMTIGCEKEDSDGSNSIIGDWTILSQTNECELFFEVGNTILFRSDGTFTLERTDNSYGTNWSSTVNTLTMEFECNDCPMSMEWNYEIGENTMLLTFVNFDEETDWDCELTLIKS